MTAELETAEQFAKRLHILLDTVNKGAREALLVHKAQEFEVAVALIAKLELLAEIRAYVAAGGTPSPDIEALLSFLDAAYAEPATGQKEAP